MRAEECLVKIRYIPEYDTFKAVAREAPGIVRYAEDPEEAYWLVINAIKTSGIDLPRFAPLD